MSTESNPPPVVEETPSTPSVQQSPSPSPLPPPIISESERTGYYSGIAGPPVLVGRSGFKSNRNPWNPQSSGKRMSPPSRHGLMSQWTKLSTDVVAMLKEHGLRATVTCIDVFRIGYTGGEEDPLVIWIGVVPRSFESHFQNYVRHSDEEYCDSADAIRSYICSKVEGEGVEVEFREAIVMGL